MRKILLNSILIVTLVLLTASLTIADGITIGQSAPEFKLKNVNEEMVSLSDYNDKKGVIVIFTCNHCPFSKKYESRIKMLNDKMQSKGFPVVAINPNDVSQVPEDSFTEMQKRAYEQSYTFPYLYDESQDIAKAYGAARTPHVFILVNNESKFTVEYIGAIDNNVEDSEAVTAKYVEDAIEAIIIGEKPKKNETKAIGCTIKWKK